jgi:hypothetical protein
MKMPMPRGELSEHVIATLGEAPGRRALAMVSPTDVEDEQVGLFLLQQMSYRPIDGVDPGWEDDESFLVLRERIEQAFEDRLRDEVRVPDCEPARVPQALLDLLEGASGPSLSGWMDENGTLDHLREFVIHRSPYQLQEADPHSFAIPRLAAGKAKTALLELQLDEYGGHEPSEAHAALFAETMRAVGLDPDAGADIDLIPAVTLATNTVLNRLGRTRRLIGALIGHLAVFEMTSVRPMANYAAVCRRLLDAEAGTRAARFFDVHVAADGLHARMAMERLVDGLAEQFPDDAPGVLFGAAALMHVEGAFTDHLLTCWKAGESSLTSAASWTQRRATGTGSTTAAA